MNSEKVKKIKKVLECMSGLCKDDRTFTCYSCVINQNFTPERAFKEALTLVNELESENERLVKELEDMPIPFMGCMLENQLLSDISKEKSGEIKALKDRIAELEKENESLKKQLIAIDTLDETNFEKRHNAIVFITKKELKQLAERMKKKFKDYEALTYKNNEVTYHNLELEIEEALKECLND